MAMNDRARKAIEQDINYIKNAIEKGIDINRAMSNAPVCNQSVLAVARIAIDQDCNIDEAYSYYTDKKENDFRVKYVTKWEEAKTTGKNVVVEAYSVDSAKVHRNYDIESDVTRIYVMITPDGRKIKKYQDCY